MPSKRKMSQRGKGFLDTLKSIGNTINDGLKKSKIISTVAGLAPIPYSGAVSSVARNMGYGRKRKMKGKGAVKLIRH